MSWTQGADPSAPPPDPALPSGTDADPAPPPIPAPPVDVDPAPPPPEPVEVPASGQSMAIMASLPHPTMVQARTGTANRTRKLGMVNISSNHECSHPGLPSVVLMRRSAEETVTRRSSSECAVRTDCRVPDREGTPRAYGPRPSDPIVAARRRPGDRVRWRARPKGNWLRIGRARPGRP